MAQRIINFEIEDPNKENAKVSLRLRKWSMTKCLSVLNDIGEIAKAVGDDWKTGVDLSAAQLAQLLVHLGGETVSRVTRIVKDSIDEPKLTVEQIQEWDLESFVAVLTKIIEQNLTETLVKNFSSLKTAVVNRLPAPQPRNS